MRGGVPGRLSRVGVPAWKVGAGEVNNLPMLEKLRGTGKPGKA